MKAVNVGQLRKGIRLYLDRVREGAEVIVADRDRPFARIIPLDARPREFTVLHPKKSVSSLKGFPSKNTPRVKNTTSLATLKTERSRG